MTGDATDAGSGRRRSLWRLPSGAVVYVGFVAIFAFFAITLRDSGFLTVDNQLNILRQTAFVSIMAFGMTFALSAGEIDLSIGSVVALSAMVVAVWLRDASAAVAVPAGLAVGVVVGLTNGLLTTRLRVPSFLITLGTAGIVGGLSRWITNLQPVPVQDDWYTFVFGSGNIGPFPTLFLWTIAVMVVAHIAFRKATFGRRVLATGGNRVAARYSGINTQRVRVLALTICSVTAALAGLLYVGRDRPAHRDRRRRDRRHEHGRRARLDRRRAAGVAGDGRAEQRADPHGVLGHGAGHRARRDHHRRGRRQPSRGPGGLR